MKKRFFLLCAVILQLTFIGYAQKGHKPGYIITNDFDTLRGFIKLKSNFEYSESCDFSLGSDQSFKGYSPGEIRGFRVENSKFYMSKNVEIDSVRKKIFLEYLVDGIVKLYYYKGAVNEYYFIEKDTVLTRLSNERSIVTVKGKGGQGEYESSYYKNSNQYKRVLQYLFQESPEALKEIPNTAFDYRPLIKITKDYHNSVCKDRNCIDFTKSTSKSLYLEPYIGFISSRMGLHTSKNYATEVKPYLGIQLRLKPFKGFSMWNLLVGLNYSTNEFQGNFENTLGYGLPYIIHTSYNIIRVPITVEYSIPLEKLQPYFSLSYNNVLLSNTSYEILRVHLNQQDPIESYFRKYQYGAALGVGLRYMLSGKNYFFVKGEYEYRIPGANFGYVLDETSVYSGMINFGYGFKIK